jgi:hypothetical protein
VQGAKQVRNPLPVDGAVFLSARIVLAYSCAHISGGGTAGNRYDRI